MPAKTTEPAMVTVTDLTGNEIKVPAGLDGKNPVSPNNPPVKAVAESDRDEALEAREAELEFAEAAGGATNKDDNAPARKK